MRFDRYFASGIVDGHVHVVVEQLLDRRTATNYAIPGSANTFDNTRVVSEGPLVFVFHVDGMHRVLGVSALLQLQLCQLWVQPGVARWTAIGYLSVGVVAKWIPLLVGETEMITLEGKKQLYDTNLNGGRDEHAVAAQRV